VTVTSEGSAIQFWGHVLNSLVPPRCVGLEILWISNWWLTYPPETYESDWIIIPIEWKVIKVMLCHVPNHQPDIDESTITPTISPSYIFRSWAPSMANKKLENHETSPYKNLETLGESPPLGFQTIWVDPKSSCWLHWYSRSTICSWCPLVISKVVTSWLS